MQAYHIKAQHAKAQHAKVQHAKAQHAKAQHAKGQQQKQNTQAQLKCNTQAQEVSATSMHKTQVQHAFSINGSVNINPHTIVRSRLRFANHSQNWIPLWLLRFMYFRIDSKLISGTRGIAIVN